MAGIEDEIRNCPWGPVWILSDSKAAIAVVVNAGRTGRASTGSLANAVAQMVYRVRRRGEGAMKLTWVKGHAGVVGNEEADKRAGFAQVIPGRDRLPRVVSGFLEGGTKSRERVQGLRVWKGCGVREEGHDKLHACENR